MAINLTDFDKIWASSSPLTPYSFSDANYEEGWNFVGATPPARQMWDGYMKWSDEKQQWIVNNFLPLSGGTMTGDIVLSSSSVSVKPSDTSQETVFGNDYLGGGRLIVFGKDNANAGLFSIQASDGVNTKPLIGKPDGTLTWNGQSIPDRSYGVTIVSTAGQNTYTFDLIENSAVIFAKRGNNASISMVTYWDSTATTFVTAGTNPVSITTSANSTSVTITNTTSSAIAVKILNGGKL